MDLLADYDSSSDDDNDHQSDNKNSSVVLHDKNKSTQQPAVWTVDSSHRGDSNDQTTRALNLSETKKTKQQKKLRSGKKILSLTAVLPQHILDQLTKSQVRSGGGGGKGTNVAKGTDENDYDSDEEDSDTPFHHPNAQPKQAQPNHASKDEGLASLLSELHAAPTAGSFSSSSQKNASGEQKSTIIGQEFLRTTTVVETRRRLDTNADRGSSVIRDIHSEPTRQEVQIKRPPEAGANAVSPPSAQPILAKPNEIIPPAIRRPVLAAPPVVRPHATSPPVPPSEPAPATTATFYEEPAASAAPPTTVTTSEARKQNKRSRQEMERALRQGNISILHESSSSSQTGGGSIISMQAPAPHLHAAEVNAAAASVPIVQHGIKVVPTAVYDPSLGQAVPMVGGKGPAGRGKGSGKNQIHHVMAAAANFELQRAQASARGRGGNAHRANAKQKYGW